MNVISDFFLITRIHSTAYLKTYEQAKYFFNSSNTQSLSKEYLQEKVKRLLVCVLFPILNLRHDMGSECTSG